MYYNRIILVGRLTRDPELRATADGVSVVRFTLAVDRSGRAGEERQTDFFDIVAFRQLADTVANYMTKGRLVLVEGRMQIRTYTDREGNSRKSYEVHADIVRFLERPRDIEALPSAAEGTVVSAAAPRTVERSAPADAPAPDPEYSDDYGDMDLGSDDFSDDLDDLDGEDPFR